MTTMNGQAPLPATAGILLQILAFIPADLRGLRDRTPLVGFAGALRRSLATIRVEQLKKTERGLRLTLPQTKGSQTEAVIVPLPYVHTELCPVRAHSAWLEAGSITSRPGEGSPASRRLAGITPWVVAAIVKARAGSGIRRTGLWRSQPEARRAHDRDRPWRASG